MYDPPDLVRVELLRGGCAEVALARDVRDGHEEDVLGDEAPLGQREGQVTLEQPRLRAGHPDAPPRLDSILRKYHESMPPTHSVFRRRHRVVVAFVSKKNNSTHEMRIWSDYQGHGGQSNAAPQ